MTKLEELAKKAAIAAFAEYDDTTDWEYVVRAILTAMREPDEGMLKHMYSGPVVSWKATIDDILDV